MKKLKKLFRNEDGQVLVMFALMMTVLMGFAALVIDVGGAYVARGGLQNAADAAALAGAAANTNQVSEAKKFATANGVDETEAGSRVEVVLATIAGKKIAEKEDAYLGEELTGLEAEYRAELSQLDTGTLIELANQNALTKYVKYPQTYTASEVAKESDANLVLLAEEHHLTDRLKSFSKEQFAKNLKDPAIISDTEYYDIAGKLGVAIATNDSTGFNAIKSNARTSYEVKLIERQFSQGDKPLYLLPSKRRAELVEAIVAKLNQANQSASLTNKGALIDELVSMEGAFLKGQKIAVGKVEGTASKVKVIVSEYVPFSFARILGFRGSTISVDATAQKMSWAGDALPFINLNGKAESAIPREILSTWEKVGPGDKERIANEDLIIGEETIQVDYLDGITFKKGKVMSKIKEPLKKIVVEGNIVYLFSLKESEMGNYEKGRVKELKNGDIIPLKDTVLLECEVVEDFGGTGSETITLKFIKAYPWDSIANLYQTNTGERPNREVKLVE